MTEAKAGFDVEQTVDGNLVFRMPATLDSVSVPTIKVKCLDHVGRDISILRIDLSETRFMDSAGVGLLVTLYRTIKSGGGLLQISGAAAQPLSLLHTVGFDKAVVING